MSVTVNVEENRSVQVTDLLVETESPDRVDFTVEGVLSITEELLSEFEGSSLKPVDIEVSIDGSRTVEIDLSEGASLRLESVDIGVELPRPNDIPSGTNAVPPSADGGATSDDGRPGAIAFTLEGTISGVQDEVFESLASASPGPGPGLESITFAVEDPIRSDGGPGTDVVFEISLLGYGITIRRNGAIEIGTGGSAADIGLPG